MLVDWHVSIRRACQALLLDNLELPLQIPPRPVQADPELRIREIC